MKSVLFSGPEYSNVLSLVRPIPAVYGYPSTTLRAAAVPKSSRRVPGCPI